MIQLQVTRVVTVGTAAITAALSTALAQGQTDSQAASHPAPATPVLASPPLAVVPRLEVQEARGMVAVEQARQVSLLQSGSQDLASNPRGEAAALAPPLAVRTPPPAAASARPAPAATAPPAPAAADYPPGSIQDIIVKAFSPYGPTAVAWGLRVARCESGYNPRAVNPAGPYYGLFQFLASTFRATPYGGQDIFDPVANANAAAWKYANGGAGSWGCR